MTDVEEGRLDVNPLVPTESSEEMRSRGHVDPESEIAQIAVLSLLSLLSQRVAEGNHSGGA
ncbi:MAG: hypothetical protein M3440_02345 [Chloroflexota bacterium]|nr:hypothetical protein [Chloroflexota bacterium]